MTLSDYVNDESILLSRRLSRTLREAERVGEQAVAEWCRAELQGYERGGQLPDYRYQPSQIICTMQAGLDTVQGVSMPDVRFLQDYRESMESSTLAEGITQLEQMQPVENELARPIEDEVLAIANFELVTSMRRLIYCSVPVPTGQIARCLTGAEIELSRRVSRSEALRDISVRMPSALQSTPTVQGDLNQYFGDVDQSVKTTVQNVVAFSIQQYNFNSLAVFLAQQGVATEQIEQLQPILEEDNEAGLREWVNHQADSLTEGAKGIAKDTAKAVVTKVLVEGLVKYGIPLGKLVMLGIALAT